MCSGESSQPLTLEILRGMTHGSQLGQPRPCRQWGRGGSELAATQEPRDMCPGLRGQGLQGEQHGDPAEASTTHRPYPLQG